jgi:hypothetical protein
MKSLGYAYAEHLGDGVDVEWYFESIVNGEIEIPKWFVEEWMEANPIFASEENDDKTIEMLIARGYILSPNGDPTNPEHWSNPPEIRKPTAGPTSWTPASETFGAEDYEVIMTNIGHSMERDGETIVFGDVVFATPNDGRSRISSYGQGADKASARQALIDRATDYLQEEEFNAETKSWRYQKRDASGRFAKGFQETVELSDFMEMNPDELPTVTETYTPEQVVAFINDCINDDDFPERMLDQVFLDSIQKVTAAADVELLEGLNAAANTALIENGIYDDRAGMAGAKRAIFVTDVFLNFKWGQENWAAENY